jgi:hypothetical protein
VNQVAPRSARASVDVDVVAVTVKLISGRTTASAMSTSHGVIQGYNGVTSVDHGVKRVPCVGSVNAAPAADWIPVQLVMSSLYARRIRGCKERKSLKEAKRFGIIDLG